MEAQIELIETACTCNFPLLARVDRAKPTEPVQFFVRPARVNQPPTIRIDRCRNCRRALPQLTPEQFKDTLGLYL